MKIKVVSAVGTGKTSLSAFDNALRSAGVYNYNLIILSSVIPLGAKVTRQSNVDSGEIGGVIGDRLYVVKADIRSDHSGKVIAAALGWYTFANGAGIFVEHEEEGFTKKGVETELRFKIRRSVQDLCEFRGEVFDRKKMGISMAICKVDTQPACALTLAVYKSEPW